MGELAPKPNSAVLAEVLARTPARLLQGRAGAGYRTGTALKLREDHAIARDAVHAEVDLAREFAGFDLIGVQTRARSKAEYLMRPDLGRRLNDGSRQKLRTQCTAGADLQVFVGDGLSAAAVAAQAPSLLAGLNEETTRRNWRLGTPFFVKYCRVGVMNDVGDLLNPQLVILLIGERPGLATAESLSAYLAFRPRTGHTDADRNLISNIHSQGIPVPDAIHRILALAEQMRALGRSGTGVMEQLNGVPIPLTPSPSPAEGEGR